MRISAFSVLALGFGLGLVGFQLTACSNSADDCNATATCGSTSAMPQAGSAGKSGGGSDTGGDGAGGKSGGGASTNGGSSGSEGVGGEGGNGPGACKGDVSEDAACWTTNDLGVFVSSDSGDDSSGNGTKEAPFKSITKGIAAAAGKNVYVCVGEKDYAEKITLDAASDGIHIYGGFECANWTYATTRSAQVLSPSNIALRIDGLKKGAQIENVSFQAADATGTGADASSYGAFVTGSKGVEFTRVELKAGKGAEGAEGEPGEPGLLGSASDPAPVGKPATCTAPPVNLPGGTWTGENVCGSAGGKGGDAGKGNGTQGADGIPIEHVAPVDDETGKGGLGSSDAAKGRDGDDGQAGDSGDPGTAAAEQGTFTGTGFLTSDGKPGVKGFAGQGGGGGGASRGNASCVGASGGAGGMGGCGGTGGKAGGGGGASTGLLSWESQVSLVACELKSGAGGAGGPGGIGGSGGIGAVGGVGGEPFSDAGNTIARGGQGGIGGDGGRGGNGSGGTGGPSYALVYSGTKPIFDVADTMLIAGTPGAHGVGGQQVSTTKAPDGSDGAAAKEFEVQ